MLHHLWLCRSRIGVTEVNLLGSCWNLVHNAGVKWRYKWYTPRAISVLPALDTASAFHQKKLKKERSEVMYQDIFHSSSCFMTVWQWERKREMAKVWHTHDWQLVSVLQPGTLAPLRPVVVAEDFSLVCVFLVLCYNFFTPLCLWRWMKTFWMEHDVNTDTHTHSAQTVKCRHSYSS